MIKLQNIKFKNILSYGNNWTTFDFKEGINKISAPNGVGKSTLVDALNFALFGTAFRAINKSQIINSKNKKNMEVILTFQKQDDIFRIERGIKPDIFKIFKNDDIVPVSSSTRGYQEILEEDIIQFDENIYNQVTTKSSTKNTAFMTLKKADKRKVIENVFDIEVFSIMGKNLKVKIDSEEIELKSIKKDIEHTCLMIGQEQSNLEKLINLKRKMEEEANQNIEIYKDEIEKLEENNNKYIKGLSIISKKKIQKSSVLQEISTIKDKISELNSDITKAETTLQMNEKKLKFLSNTCGECPKIKELTNDLDVSRANESIKNCKELLPEKLIELKKQEEILDKINEILSNEKFVNTNLIQNKQRITMLQGVINKAKTSSVVIDETILNDFYTKKKVLEDKYNTTHKNKIHLSLLRNLCSDDGIKTFIIKKYLPTINKLLNTYLTKFQSDIIFNFDEEFNEIVLTKYKENFSYDSFSQGQKKRIDLAVMFTFIKFAQLKNKKSDTNILIMDEVLTGLDQQGTESVMEVLADYRDKNNKCIITINHLTDLNEEFFDNKYKVTLEKGFSKITEELL